MSTTSSRSSSEHTMTLCQAKIFATNNIEEIAQDCHGINFFLYNYSTIFEIMVLPNT